MMKDLYQKFLNSTGVSTDTRTVAKGNLFFALKGENFNGNQYAEQAINKGASFALIDEAEYQLNEQYILVEDVLQTLQALATHHRKQFKIPIIAITGTNGKTTTKELINAIVSTTLETFATQGNFNNHIGVPLSLLSIKKETKVAIIEMGANHLGEIAEYCQWAQPTHGIITNIGNGHLEGFGSYENVIRAKSELYDYLKANQRIVLLNDDDFLLKDTLGNYEYTITYGTKPEVDAQITLHNAFPTVSVQYAGEIIQSNLFGEYNFNNISTALAVAWYFDIPTDKIQTALAHYKPQNNRSEIKQIDSNLVILDAYNANPTSVKAAVSSFAKLGVNNKILFIGDMFELGKQSHQLHQDIVHYIDSLNFEKVYFVGKSFAQCESKNKAQFVESTEDAIEIFQQANFTQSTLLIKGSRAMGMERIVSATK